jgi:hypothetical protein
MKIPKLWFLLAAVLVICPGAAISEGLKYLETEDLLLLYVDPSETYLVPHAARSYENSMRMQRSIFGYAPYDRPTMLMTAFTEYGNAGATPLPRNIVMVDIGPRSLTFETAASAERMWTWMNHELVHLVGTDMVNDQDRFYRRIFGGKVTAMSEYPESSL